MKRERKAFLFWIKSNRGTDDKTIVEVPGNWTNAEVQDELEEWCSHFGAWTASESICSYGFKAIKILPKNELKTKYEVACRRKQKAIDNWKILAAMYNVRKLK
jgi:hypothetical protein